MERITGCAPEHICDLCHNGCSGQVEMVNSRGTYLLLEDKHILLCHRHFGVVPNGVAVDGWDLLPSLLTAGQPVQAEEMVLSFPSGSLELTLQSIPKDTRILHPDERRLEEGLKVLLANTKQTGLSCLAYPLFDGQMPPVNIYCSLALPHAKALLQALREEDTAAIKASVSSLLGLGPGLTPSGDDWLSGLLYGLRHSAARDTAGCVALTTAIRELAPERTNAVSADYLLSITDDAPFDRMAAAWADPAVGSAELVQIGNNSGSEMLLGLLCAGSVLSDLQKRGE